MNTSTPRAYRKSDSDLADTLPDEWEERRMSRLVQLVSQKADASVFQLGLESIQSWSGRLIANDSVEYEGEGIAFSKGDVLFGKLRPYLAKAWLADRDGAAVGDFHVYRPERMDGKYLLYLMLNSSYIDLVNGSTFGSKMPRVSWDFVRSIKLPLPLRQEQRQIAAYLDRETGQIDELILKQEQLVATLTERRQSTIAHNVTRGISKFVKTKSIAAPWVREIPTGWTAGNIRHFASMKTGHTPSRSEPTYWENTSIPWFTLADVWQLRAGAKYMGETAQKISTLGLANSAAELLPAGTVVLSRTASVGFTGIMPHPMATSQDYWNWVPGSSLISEYLWYQLQALRPHLMSLMHGSTHNTIYQADAAGIWLVVPPIDEQLAIVSLLNSELAKSKALIENATKMIALLRERRQALISAAVTGKIDVRGL